MQEAITDILSRNTIVDFFDGYETYFEDIEIMDEDCTFEIEEIEFLIK